MLQRVENDARSILNWYTFYRVGVSLREKDKKMLWSVKKGLSALLGGGLFRAPCVCVLDDLFCREFKAIISSGALDCTTRSKRLPELSVEEGGKCRVVSDQLRSLYRHGRAQDAD